MRRVDSSDSKSRKSVAAMSDRDEMVTKTKASTKGHRKLFLRDMYCQSKLSDVNHSQLCRTCKLTWLYLICRWRTCIAPASNAWTCWMQLRPISDASDTGIQILRTAILLNLFKRIPVNHFDNAGRSGGLWAGWGEGSVGATGFYSKTMWGSFPVFAS